MTHASYPASAPPLPTRAAIQAWLRQRRKAVRGQAIAVFAAECAGTPLDLDAELEAAAAAA